MRAQRPAFARATPGKQHKGLLLKTISQEQAGFSSGACEKR
jgi:hypothetical protein